MAKYRVTEPSFLNGRYVEAGDVIEYDGIPGFNLEPIDEAAKQAKEAAGAAGKRDVNGRAFQEDLTRSDGAPSALVTEAKAEPKAEPDPAPEDEPAKQAKSTPDKGK